MYPIVKSLPPKSQYNKSMYLTCFGHSMSLSLYLYRCSYISKLVFSAYQDIVDDSTLRDVDTSGMQSNYLLERKQKELNAKVIIL